MCGIFWWCITFGCMIFVSFDFTFPELMALGVFDICSLCSRQKSRIMQLQWRRQCKQKCALLLEEMCVISDTYWHKSANSQSSLCVINSLSQSIDFQDNLATYATHSFFYKHLMGQLTKMGEGWQFWIWNINLIFAGLILFKFTIQIVFIIVLHFGKCFSFFSSIWVSSL